MAIRIAHKATECGSVGCGGCRSLRYLRHDVKGDKRGIEQHAQKRGHRGQMRRLRNTSSARSSGPPIDIAHQLCEEPYQ